MVKRIRLGVFDRVGMRSGWSHPLSEGLRYRDITYWTEKARLLDEGGFDFLFLADVLGYAVDEDGFILPGGVRGGGSVPRMDPLAVIPAMAAVTDRLGFIATAVTGLEPPAKLARTLSSFDHITRGRIAWNIVTGASQDALARLYGHERLTPHAERYARAHEFVSIALRYWEGCWEPDAYVGDKARRVFADPDKLHRIDFEGEYYRTSGYLTADPSPQRTPMLVQAGTSEAGKAFAAEYAEAVFLQAHLSENIADMRSRALQGGRRAEDMAFFTDVRVFTGPSEESAQAEAEAHDGLHSIEAVASGFRGLTGIDLLLLDFDKPLTQLPPEKLHTELDQATVDRYIARQGEPEVTVGEILMSMRGPAAQGSTFVGLGPDVADRLIDFVDSHDLDGIMLDPVFDLHTIRNFIQFVVPELVARGRVSQPEGATIRARMMGYGDHLPDRHVGASYRPASAIPASAAL